MEEFRLTFRKFNTGKFHDDMMEPLVGYYILASKISLDGKRYGYNGMSESLRKSVMNKLSSMFSSIEYSRGPRMEIGTGAIINDRFVFKFKDEAEEAFFILWASDGFIVSAEE